MPTEVSVKKRKGIFPGYLMAIAGGTMLYWACGAYMYSFGNFVKPLTDAFNWSRAQVSIAFSLARLEGGFEAPIAAIATDKWGPRVVCLIGFILLGLGFIAMYYVNSLWMFYGIWLIGSTGYNLGVTRPLEAAMANWFVRRRGFMVSLMRLGMSLSGPTMVPFMMWLLLQYGWQKAFLYTGVATIFIGVPLILFFIKPRRPEYYGWMPDGKRVDEEMAADTEATIKKGVEYAAEREEVEFTVRQAMRDKTFWIFTVAVSLRGMVHPVLTVHTVPFLLDMGIDPMVAAAAVGTIVFARFPTNLFFGWLGDHIPKEQLRYWAMLGHAMEAIGIFFLIKATSMSWVWAYVILSGLGNGASMAITSPLRGRYWGRKAFGTIAGTIAGFSTVAGIVSPIYAGWAYDTTGSYTSAFTIILILTVISIVVMFFATPPKPPEKITHITDFV
ncbi:MFS transporter [Chloroflexota bacterium]